MSIPYYQVDAFTSRVFYGNPAGVCLLADWLPDGTASASEGGLSLLVRLPSCLLTGQGHP